jgi:methylated-DNA-[protein]-cysteine S-methyltransferase
MQAKNEFSDTVRKIVQGIPRGRTLSYKEVATLAGNTQAARAVAMVMARNFDPAIPCHRVIRSDGKLGGYNRGGVAMKRQLLQGEGVTFI